MEINLVAEGLKFMVLGMSTVFVFLILMVFILKIQSKIILKLFPIPEKKPAAQKSATQGTDATLIAVITAAITQHRNQNK